MEVFEKNIPKVLAMKYFKHYPQNKVGSSGDRNNQNVSLLVLHLFRNFLPSIVDLPIKNGDVP